METFPNPNPAHDYHIHIDSREFTCLCPKTGQPDFAEIQIDYVPNQLCVELKSLKLYYWSFRDEGHFHEQVTHMIADELIALLDPRYLKLTTAFNVRGGIYTTVVVEHHDALSFTKMQAQGNDFVILDGRINPLPELTREFVRGITERHHGIGCDQLLGMLPDENADIRLRIFNNDGSEAENCGNGLRCVAGLLLEHHDAPSVDIRISDRLIHAERHETGILVHMGAATVTDRTDSHVDVEIGNSHRVFFKGAEGCSEDRNIDIISGQTGDDVYVDMIERGSGYTLACGSGACAVAVAIWAMEQHVRPLTIHMHGGDVVVSGTPDAIMLEGLVSLVCTGEYRIS